LRLTISDGLALVFATKPAGSWSKYSSFSGMSLSKQRSGTWVANSDFKMRSTITLAWSLRLWTDTGYCYIYTPTSGY